MRVLLCGVVKMMMLMMYMRMRGTRLLRLITVQVGIGIIRLGGFLRRRMRRLNGLLGDGSSRLDISLFLSMQPVYPAAAFGLGTLVMVL